MEQQQQKQNTYTSKVDINLFPNQTRIVIKLNDVQIQELDNSENQKYFITILRAKDNQFLTFNEVKLLRDFRKNNRLQFNLVKQNQQENKYQIQGPLKDFIVECRNQFKQINNQKYNNDFCIISQFRKDNNNNLSQEKQQQQQKQKKQQNYFVSDYEQWATGCEGGVRQLLKEEKQKQKEEQKQIKQQIRQEKQQNRKQQKEFKQKQRDFKQQQKEQDQKQVDENLDPKKIYTTDLQIRKFGRAIGIDLKNSNLPIMGKIPPVHATILFRQGGYGDQEIQRVQSLAIKYLNERNKQNLTFQLPKMWGRNSAFLVGEAADFIEFARKECADILEDARAPHVKLR